MKKIIASLLGILVAGVVFAETDYVAIPRVKRLEDTLGRSKTDAASVGIKVDTISEQTAATGVTIDSVLLKDGGVSGSGRFVTTATGAVGTPVLQFGATNGIYQVSATQVGLVVNGVLVALWDDNGLVADTISEKTSTVGVTADGVLLKDGNVTAHKIIDNAGGVAAMWYTAAMSVDPSLYSTYYDDFYEAGYVADAATTNTSGKTVPGGFKFAETADHAAWMVTVVDGDSDEAESIKVGNNMQNGILQITCNDKANDAVNVQLEGEAVYADNTRDLWYETSIIIEDVSEDTVFWGLSVTDGDLNGGLPADYMLFTLDQSTNVSFVMAKGGVAVTNANITTLADVVGDGSDFKRFGIFVDGSATNCYVYVNGSAVATNAASASLPNDDWMSPVFEITTTDTGSDYLLVDYLKIIQTR